MAENTEYEVIVIGGGAAGMTAAMYAGRARLRTLLIEKSLLGGQATGTALVENYPGFPDGIDGTALMRLFDKQARKFGVDIKLTDVQSVENRGDYNLVRTFRTEYRVPAVIAATGGRPRLTGAPNEERFMGRGISFCATCDAPRYAGKRVLVIGSGNTALEESVYLARFAREVLISVRHEEGKTRAQKAVREDALANSRIRFLWNTAVAGFEGDDLLRRVVLKNTRTGECNPVDVDGCFLFVGFLPNTALFEGLLNLSPEGYIVTNEDMETGIAGIFAAGDVRKKTLRQIAAAVGDGAIAACMAEQYVRGGSE
jgi:thioredoxin reductase (NADPH)